MIKNTVKFLLNFPVFQAILHFWSQSIRISAEEKSFASFLIDLKIDYPKISNKNAKILLVPLINDLGTMKVSMQLAFKIANEKGLGIKFYYVHTAIDSIINRDNFFKYALQQFQNFNYFLIYKLCRIYGIKRKDIIISNYFWPGFNKTNKFNFTTKKQILDIKFQCINIGELIYDTYLRFRSQYTMDVFDPCLHDIVGYSKKLVDVWARFLGKYPVSTIILPYTSYIHWGVPVKVALERKIEVLTFGSFSYVLSSISKEHPYHSKNFHRYKEIFSKLENPNLKRRLAEETLDQRLNGIIDAGTFYMKRSAFESNIITEFLPRGRNWCVIFLHCFYDSPHIYGESLFPDFYDWLNHILSQAMELPHQDFYVKEHPNALKENKKIVQSIKEKFSKYPNIIFLSDEISNKQILEHRPSAIFTVYGTVAHEFASLGIPVIVAGKNPQSNYGFIHKPQSIQDFDNYIRNFANIGLPESYLKEEIYEFFYMHFLYYSKKFDASNFSKRLDLNIGDINLPKEIPFQDFVF